MRRLNAIDEPLLPLPGLFEARFDYRFFPFADFSVIRPCFIVEFIQLRRISHRSSTLNLGRASTISTLIMAEIYRGHQGAASMHFRKKRCALPCSMLRIIERDMRSQLLSEISRGCRPRWLQVDEMPFSRAITYKLIEAGLISSVVVTWPGSSRDRRLIDGARV